MIELGPPTKTHLLQLICDGVTVPVRYAPLLHIDDPEGAYAAAMAGLGIGALPRFLVSAAIGDGRLVHLMPDWAPPPAPLHLLHRTDVALPLRVRAYLEFLAETTRHQSWQ